MKIRTLIAMLALCGASAAGAATQTNNYGAFSLSYDDSTVFAGPSFSFSSSGDITGFGWKVPNAVSLISYGGDVTNVFDLPSFTISANSGYSLSAFSSSFGNLVFVETNSAKTSVLATAVVSIDGGAPALFGGNVAKVTTSTDSNHVGGYFGDSSSIPGSFTSLSVSHATLTLKSLGSGFSYIAAQPQNELTFSMVAVPVPEPESYAMLLAGLGLIGAVARRGKRQA